ncbi:response regulator receiver sensor signal transduction histidine kinase [Gloeothece citriformis PCC 7424]|uniref:histidine kinase n=1 Tax=Gloeothece citriformis (strain PCC 7424) TaxID=65393 RepID=B7K8A6_GLOC7|nr:hybrid sensor histidine kinase/response regulator [Gloeothece citriformis]ACK69866.1 response regulator receiver sensor signal transduction histidine kinase [Gloeothece citriformis PCC 7424]
MSHSLAYLRNYILAVDDNPDNLFLIKLALEQEGYRVHLVEDGLTALAQIQYAPPDLILLDVMMPGINGYEVTRRIRQNPNIPFIPILLITAYEEPSLVQGLDVGADEFIRKPVQIDELQARVRSLLRLKHSIDQRENFVSCLTHDLRTPLLAANRMLNLIQQGVFGDVNDQMDNAVVNIIKSNDNLLTMLNTLLEVHCYEEGQKILSFISFNWLELIDEIIAELEPLAEEKGLSLTLEVNTEIPEILGDRLEIRRVITNVISNAIKYTDEGSITVRLKQSSSGDQIIIEVEDTGIGIPPEQQDTIFERFRQGNHKRSGKGLGLYLCFQIIKAHRGTIKVQSEVDKGSIFTISLPVNNDNYE